MKVYFLSLIMFLIEGQFSNLEFGEYESLRPYTTKERKQTLIINPNGNFIHKSYNREIHSIMTLNEINGTWFNKNDTLVLIDSMVYSAGAKSALVKIFGTEDTVVVRTTKYLLKKNNRLCFIRSNAGRNNKEFLFPNFKLVK